MTKLYDKSLTGALTSGYVLYAESGGIREYYQQKLSPFDIAEHRSEWNKNEVCSSTRNNTFHLALIHQHPLAYFVELDRLGEDVNCVNAHMETVLHTFVIYRDPSPENLRLLDFLLRKIDRDLIGARDIVHRSAQELAERLGKLQIASLIKQALHANVIKPEPDFRLAKSAISAGFFGRSELRAQMHQLALGTAERAVEHRLPMVESA